MKRVPIYGDVDWKVLMEQTDKDLRKPAVEYEFSNGRKFVEQIPGGGLYTPPVIVES